MVLEDPKESVHKLLELNHLGCRIQDQHFKNEITLAMTVSKPTQYQKIQK